MAFNIHGREQFEIDIGDKVQVLSDKAFRRFKEDEFEALGNVIITYGDESIYGEKASLSLKTGQIHVVSNVRYISPTITLYSSRLNYNFKTKYLSVTNARVLADNYMVLGKEMQKTPDGIIIAEDAEYTTCKDCPESWSIFGKRVRITPGEYIRIWHAYIKIRGVIVMYLPYVVLPVKKERESGLLFPALSFGSKEGILFRIPYFWAINDYSDMTLTPFSFGRRGYGSEVQYRHIFSNKKWFEFDTLYASDAVYAPGKLDMEKTGYRENRYFGSYEHHFSTSEHWNHHFRFDGLDDLDVVRDFDFYTIDSIKAPDIGASGFLNFRQSLFQLSLEGNFRRNQLFHKSKEFDHRYVQVLPDLSLSTSPLPLYQSNSSFLRKILFGVDSDYTVFKQNHRIESDYIRNATRLNNRPYIKAHLGNIGSVNFDMESTFEHQYYHFNHLDQQKFFYKQGLIHQSEASLSLSKVYGEASIEKLPIKIDQKKDGLPKDPQEEDLIIGQIPPFEEKFSQDEITISKSSYKHNQHFIFRHYLLSDQKTRGNQKFLNQISLNDGRGQFDYIDAIRSKEHLIQQQENLVTIPKTNTFEIQWNNTLVRKTVNPLANAPSTSKNKRNTFDYREIAFFNVSQGYDLSLENAKSSDRLTRLSLRSGINQDSYSITGEEYYFYSYGEHIFNLNYTHRYDWGNIALIYSNDSLSRPVRNFSTLGLDFSFFDQFKIYTYQNYDFEEKQKTEETYGLFYTPSNNCWMMNLNYQKKFLEGRISVNFLVNFNENNFQGLSEF